MKIHLVYLILAETLIMWLEEVLLGKLVHKDLRMGYYIIVITITQNEVLSSEKLDG